MSHLCAQCSGTQACRGGGVSLSLVKLLPGEITSYFVFIIFRFYPFLKDRKFIDGPGEQLDQSLANLVA